MKSVYKRSISKMIFSIIGAPIGGVIVAGITSFFLDTKIAVGIGIFVCLVLIYMAIFSDSIKFEIEGTTLRYFAKNKLVKEYELKGANVSYNIRQSSTADDVNLYINGDIIDCAPLGLNKFDMMYAEIEKLTGIKQKIIVGGKKDE